MLVATALVGSPLQAAAVQAAAPTPAFAWGWNGDGELGIGTADFNPHATPVSVTNLAGVTHIDAGDSHSLALKSDGTVLAWGSNSIGKLGIGTADNNPHPTPVPVTGLTGVTAISVGLWHSLALKNDGTVVAWGWNTYGQLGDGTTTQRFSPVPVIGLTGVIGIAAGTTHSLALKHDGTVVAWGWNTYGQLGDSTTTQRLSPVPVTGLIGVTAISAGDLYSLAIKHDGTVAAWGHNGYGELGIGTVDNSPHPAPVWVTGPRDVTAIAAGYDHSLALRSDGTVLAWGDNRYGQLGDGTTTHRSTPVHVTGLRGVTAIDGFIDSMALKSDGTVVAWGWNGFGQLGIGTVDNNPHPTPAAVSGLQDVTAIAAGTQHSLALGR